MMGISTKQPTKQGRKPTKRQKTEAAENNLIQKAIVCMDKASHVPQQTEDGCELFGRYVASEVRAISNPQSQRWAKLQIQTVLFNAQTEPPPQLHPWMAAIPTFHFHGNPASPLHRQWRIIHPTPTRTPINCACCFSYLINISVRVFIMCNFYACTMYTYSINISSNIL